MSTKKIQILGSLGTKVYSQNDEPTDAVDGALWIDLDSDQSGSSQSATVESIILRSSTEGSSKIFKITIGDDGVLTATEIVESTT